MAYRKFLPLARRRMSDYIRRHRQLRATADADHGQLPGKSVGAISTSRYLPFVHGPGAGTASDPHAPIFIAPAKLLSVKLLGFKFALYSDQQ